MNTSNYDTDIAEKMEPQATSRPISSDSLLRVSDAAAMLGVHPNTIRIWTDSGVLESYRIGPRQDRRIPASVIKAMMETHEDI